MINSQATRKFTVISVQNISCNMLKVLSSCKFLSFIVINATFKCSCVLVLWSLSLNIFYLYDFVLYCPLIFILLMIPWQIKMAISLLLHGTVFFSLFKKKKYCPSCLLLPHNHIFFVFYRKLHDNGVRFVPHHN